MKKTRNKIKEFLVESNAIEGVYDDASYRQARIAWDWLIRQKEMSPHVVLKAHKLLMLHQNTLHGFEKGYFRRVPVWIGGNEAMDWREIDTFVRGWCEDMSYDWSDKSEDEREKLSREYHVIYETIHPFVDGNGRTGRMFMNWWRIRNGLPALVIHRGEEQYDYYKWFK